ncbi:MAG: serine hydrolase, partial [Caldilineaceae bacterium]|nr:serine hydrolase [Caldilineaceae bacterium]
NQRDDWNTNPDSNLQSTPTEMGRILTAIYECTLGKGLLLEVYPDDFTPAECEYMLFYLSHDHFQELLWAGVPRPRATWFLHKHGFAYESHSDVALVWGPTGPYVLSVFLYRAGWMDWDTSNRTMQDVSRITWNFFALQAQQGGLESGTPPELTPPPVYAPVPNFVPAS